MCDAKSRMALCWHADEGSCCDSLLAPVGQALSDAVAGLALAHSPRSSASGSQHMVGGPADHVVSMHRSVCHRNS